MRTVLHLVVAASNLVLALPPGSCGALVYRDRAKPAPVQGTCCHGKAQDNPGQSRQVPHFPTTRCCCRRDAAVPEKPVQPPDASATAVPLLADAPFILVGQARSDTADVAASPPSRLHVLQCVWRC